MKSLKRLTPSTATVSWNAKIQNVLCAWNVWFWNEQRAIQYSIFSTSDSLTKQNYSIDEKPIDRKICLFNRKTESKFFSEKIKSIGKFSFQIVVYIQMCLLKMKPWQWASIAEKKRKKMIEIMWFSPTVCLCEF